MGAAGRVVGPTRRCRPRQPDTEPGRWSAALRLVAVPAAVAFAVFAPWLIRNTLVLGSPLPGQTVANALSITGFEIFAFADPPTLQRYLALGATRLLEMRLDGFEHNVMDVLVLPAFPVGVIGLVALPWFGRGLALRPLLLVSVMTFTFTTLVFPVSTTWGTYLHAAGPAHVLLIVTCLFGLDALIVRVGVIRGWTRPVAWLGPALTVSCAAVFGAVFVMNFGAQAQETQQRYAQLPAALAAAGVPAADAMGPVISDHPIWWAEAFRGAALGLPDESPGSVLKLARTFPGTRYLVLSSTHDRWPGILADGDPDAACFREVALPSVASGATPALATTRVFELVCP